MKYEAVVVKDGKVIDSTDTTMSFLKNSDGIRSVRFLLDRPLTLHDGESIHVNTKPEATQ